MLTDPAHALVWSSSYVVTSCIRPGFFNFPGLYLGVGTSGDFVYFVCRTLGTSAPLSLAFAGPSGAVRIDLGSPDPTKQIPQEFTTEYFPFAADFTFGSSSGDPNHDLLYLLTGGGSNKFYVFDAARRSFTGSVPLQSTPRGGPNVMGAAADSSTGRAYLVLEDFQIIATDANTLPVQQGRAPAVAWRSFGNQPPVFDPGTRRLFLAGNQFCDVSSVDAGTCGTPGVTLRNAASFRVFQDDAPYVAPTQDDPDALTHDTPEVPGVTPVDYSSFASAYGARLSAVGGVKGTQAENTYNGAVIGLHNFVPDAPSIPDTDRTVYLGQVAGTELSPAAAKADAAPVAIDDTTQADASGVQSYARSQLPEDMQKQLEPADQHVAAGRAQIAPAACSDLGGKPTRQINPSATAGAYCDNTGLKAGAESATAPPAPLATPGGVAVSVAAAGSWTSLTRDAADGSVATATAIARGVHIDVPGAGSVDIGEVKTVAASAAHGRPGTATSSFTRAISDVVVRDARGDAQFSCGFEPSPMLPPGAGNPCHPDQVTRQLDARFPGRLKFVTPDPDTDPRVAGSPGGAKAVVIKSPYVQWNGYNTSHDGSKEVPGLQVLVLNDYNQPSRLVMSLAGVNVESNYRIGLAPPPPALLKAPSLRINLVDGSTPAVPLSGATFELRGPAGTTPLSCLTAADGIGTCTFPDMKPGSYLIREKTAPPGYAKVADYELALEAGKDYKTTFINLPAIGSVRLTLSSAGDDGGPLAGGVFAMFEGASTLGTPLANCTTDDDGACGFAKVPLGDYTMQQVSAPEGFLVSDDVAFSLTKPEEVATLHFVDGIPGKPAVPPTVIAGTPPVPPTIIPGKPAVPPKVIPGKPATPARTMVLPALGGTGDAGLSADTAGYETDGTEPLVASSPSDALAPLRLGSGGVGAVPARLARLLVHSPQQAVLLLFVWLVLGLPVYLWVRRRQFLSATEGI
jgi:hypothetical protein